MRVCGCVHVFMCMCLCVCVCMRDYIYRERLFSGLLLSQGVQSNLVVDA